MSRNSRFENYPEKLYTCSIKELEQWLKYWNQKVELMRGVGRNGAMKEKILVETLLSKKRNKALYNAQSQQ